MLVTPAPGQPGKMPFWHGDAPGRPLELGRALGAFLREVGSATPEAGLERARAAGLDEWGAANLQAYLAEQKAATGHLPDDRTLLVERFRDELGDWRLVVHSPFGAQVNAPWALVLAARLRERYGVDVASMHSDDGIVLRLEQLAGALVPASALESLVLPARVRDYSPAMLDELTSAGEVLWAGAGGLPGGDGWISLVPADLAPLLLPEPLEVPDGGRARSSSSSPAGRRCSSAGCPTWSAPPTTPRWPTWSGTSCGPAC